VIAYYTLAAGSERHAAVPGKLKRNAPDPIPLLVLARLAVDKRCQGKGLGAGLLRDALLRCVQASEVAGGRALIVHAKDDQARKFYEKYDFVEFPVGSQTLFLPIETVVKGL
jgi:GNAT superfamily N-acetyltransferase